MEVHNLKDIEKALEETRQEFHKTTASIRNLLDEAVSLFFELMGLIRAVARDTDDERYGLEALATTFRRIVSSLVLLESGLPQEAHMVLRNAWEWQLIAIDIIYNKASLQEWKQTTEDGLEDYEKWYFGTSKVYKRITTNKGNMYPKLERRLAKNTYEDWKRISNKSLHAHSRAQIKELFDDKGNFQLLGRKTEESYRNDYELYQSLIINVVSLLLGIPRYQQLIGTNKSLESRRNKFAEKYAQLLREKHKDKVIEERPFG